MRGTGRRGTAAGVAGIVALAGMWWVVPGVAAAAPLPSYDSGLRLISPTRAIVADVYPVAGGPSSVNVNVPAYVASPHRRFEVRVARPVFSRPPQVQIGDGHHWVNVSPSLIDGWSGLRSFMTVRWFDQGWRPLLRRTFDWCPNNGTPARLDPSSAATNSYLGWCPTAPFTQGMRWGIDPGWAAQLQLGDITTGLNLVVGRTYLLQINVNAPFAQILGIPARATSMTYVVKAVLGTGGCGPFPPIGCTPHLLTPAQTSPGAPVSAPRLGGSADVPAAALPDLVPLPASGISTHNENGSDWLDFGATVYNAGTGPLVVEGFRRLGTGIMTGEQYFYVGGRAIGYLPTSPLVYDARPTHQHWHWRDFARYDLLNLAGSVVTTSGKESFCIAPTDPINLLIPTAPVNPGNGDLATACGDATSIWIREVLAPGWGDTYTQARAGQSLDITHLANGIYRIRIVANPVNGLLESSTKNNVSYRTVILGGVKGNRTVTVPAYFGIDPETNVGGPSPTTTPTFLPM